MQFSFPPKFRRSGFTLVEVLVVIGIIAILSALSYSVVTSTLARSREAKCLSNLRQIGLALTSFTAENDNYLPRVWGYTNTGSDPVDWTKILDPYIPLVDGKTVYGMVYTCPSEAKPPAGNINSVRHYTASYALVSGNSGTNLSAPSRLITSIQYPSRTIAVTEGRLTSSKVVCNSSQTWNNVNSDINLSSPEETKYINFRHNQSINVLYMDGHVAPVKWTDRFNVFTQPAWRGSNF